MTQTYHSYSHQELTALSKKLVKQWERLLRYFNIKDYYSMNRYVIMPCPIHGGDNSTALNLYIQGCNNIGNWKCNTHQCEEVFQQTILGFIRGILSRQKYGWSQIGDKTASFQETLQFAYQFLGNPELKINNDIQVIEKEEFTSFIDTINIKKHKPHLYITRTELKQILDIPAEYYLNRGYSEFILSLYDIGLCKYENHFMNNRVVVPIYDDKHQFIVGLSGRSIFEKCTKCNGYHSPEKECVHGKYKECKWKHNPKFQSSQYLYNYWFAKNILQNHKWLL